MNDQDEPAAVSMIVIPTLCGFEVYDETSKDTIISWDREGDREGPGMGTLDVYQLPEEEKQNWLETLLFRWNERIGRMGSLED